MSSLDQALEMVSHPYRRRILVELDAHNPLRVDDFESGDLTIEDEDPALLEQVLYHNHLPKLAEAGYVDWNREAGTLTRGPEFEENAPVLRLIYDHQDELPDGWLR